MKEIRGLKRGVKTEPQPTNSQRIAQMDVEVKNMQMAARMTQMIVQQLLQNQQELSKDLGKAYGIINDLRYKVLAMQKVGATGGHGHFDMDALNKKAEELRLNDFIEASDVEDKKGNFTMSETVQDDSTVIITSTSAGEDAGIFRSRIQLSKCGVPALVEGFAGKPVGTKVTCQLNGVEHVVELLGIRNPPPSAPVEDVPAVEEVSNEVAPADVTVH